MNEVPLSLYIHLPWCVKKCPYCDFNSHEIKTDIPEQDYIDALIADIQLYAHNLRDREVISIFFGGGTPSVFSANSIERILKASNNLLTISTDAEITLEANPGTLDQKNFSGFRNAGVNRISIGAQSFSNSKLRALGRIHDAQTAMESVQIAKQAGFKNINLDLMYALPQQDFAAALRDIEQAIALQPSHISYYQLTIEPHTRFYRQPPNLPDDQASWEIQQAAMQLLAKHGYAQYEISAYAQSNYECIHNQNYWRFGDYLGIGAGAHQKLSSPTQNTIVRFEKPKHPQQYMKSMGSTKPQIQSHLLTKQDIIFEFMLNALRLKQGFSKQQFESYTGLYLRDIAENLDNQIEDGLLLRQGDWTRCSDQGYRFLDDLLQSWLPQGKTVGNIT